MRKRAISRPAPLACKGCSPRGTTRMLSKPVVICCSSPAPRSCTPAAGGHTGQVPVGEHRLVERLPRVVFSMAASSGCGAAPGAPGRWSSRGPGSWGEVLVGEGSMLTISEPRAPARSPGARTESARGDLDWLRPVTTGASVPTARVTAQRSPQRCSPPGWRRSEQRIAVPPSRLPQPSASQHRASHLPPTRRDPRSHAHRRLLLAVAIAARCRHRDTTR